MKDNKTALFVMAFILIGGLLASPSMQLSGVAFAQDDTDEVEVEDIDEVAEMEEVETDDSDYTKDFDDYKDSDKYEDHREKADRYCNMSEEEREEHFAK
ncbi:MAG: hypothetical protein JRZ95_06405, partial [Nitrososphaerota archaeon]|nr:hypothetical protein [Nitrososphaerota archaeon]